MIKQIVFVGAEKSRPLRINARPTFGLVVVREGLVETGYDLSLIPILATARIDHIQDVATITVGTNACCEGGKGHTGIGQEVVPGAG